MFQRILEVTLKAGSLDSSGKIKGQKKKGRTISGLRQGRAAYDGYRNNDQSAETSMDTKTHTGGTSQLEICSRLFFKEIRGPLFSPIMQLRCKRL